MSNNLPFNSTPNFQSNSNIINPLQIPINPLDPKNMPGFFPGMFRQGMPPVPSTFPPPLPGQQFQFPFGLPPQNFPLPMKIDPKFLGFPRQGFFPQIPPVNEKPYEFSFLGDEEIGKILILENLDKNVNEKTVLETINNLTPVEKVHFIRGHFRKFAFVFLKEPQGAINLKEKNKEVSNNGNINVFSHDLARDLLNERSTEIHELIQKYSKPEEFAKLLQGESLESEAHKICSFMPLSFESHAIKVREIWIGYFPMTYNQDIISKVLQKYGPVDQIDLKKKQQNFAFVRFKTAEGAYSCIINQAQISQDFGLNHKIKITYSDFMKRNHIIADDLFLTNNQKDLTNIVFVSLSLGLILVPKKQILKAFSRVGKVQNFIARPSANLNEHLKSYFLVEMESVQMAINARKYFYIDDREGRRRERLGDRKAEVNILTRTNVTGSIYNLIAPHMIRPNRNIPLQQNPVNPFLIQQNQENQIRVQENFKKEFEEKQEYPFVWTGFITRNKKFQVGVDCFQVKGDLTTIFDDSTFNLNISHRIKPEEIFSFDPQIVVIFRPANETYNEKFEEQMSYLRVKNMWGIVNYFYPNNLYLIPYGNYSKRYAENCVEGDVVGIFLNIEIDEDDDHKIDTFENQFNLLQFSQFNYSFRKSRN